ncbi:MAG: hypothetical protein ACRDFQ_05965 [Anaerolineales bacterium]
MSSTKLVGILNEASLHKSLKIYLAKPGDVFEQKVDGYLIDIVRGDTLIEIQTANFAMLRKKLSRLLPINKILLVHPIAQTKWIVRTKKSGKIISRRKSPKRGRAEHVFSEILNIPDLISHPNLTLLVVLVELEEHWRDDGKGSWTRKHWSIADRVLIEVVSEQEFNSLDDYKQLIPKELAIPFTHKQLATAINAPVWLSTRMSYCLRKMGCLQTVGKQGRSLLLAPI